MATTPNFSFLENFVLGENFSLAVKEKTYPSPSPVLRASKSFSTSLLQTLGVILLCTLLLQPLAPWLARPTAQSHTWEKTFSLPTPHLEKTTYDYDAVSGSSLYCNGDPVNGLDPDGRCVEGMGTAAYDIGTGTVKLGSNILGSTAYATASGFGTFQNEYSDNFAGSWQGLQNTWGGLKYLGSQALNGNFTTVGVALTGGEGRSASFRTGYAATSILAMALAGEVGEAGEVAEAGEIVANPVPKTVARVLPGKGPFSTLGPPGNTDVFVTSAKDIVGLNPIQLSERLTIPVSDTFTIIQFPTPTSGIASPVFRKNPGFIGRGRTLGNAEEFVIPNGPIPPEATTTVLGP